MSTSCSGELIMQLMQSKDMLIMLVNAQWHHIEMVDGGFSLSSKVLSAAAVLEYV